MTRCDRNHMAHKVSNIARFPYLFHVHGFSQEWTENLWEKMCIWDAGLVDVRRSRDDRVRGTVAASLWARGGLALEAILLSESTGIPITQEERFPDLRGFMFISKHFWTQDLASVSLLSSSVSISFICPLILFFQGSSVVWNGKDYFAFVSSLLCHTEKPVWCCSPDYFSSKKKATDGGFLLWFPQIVKKLFAKWRLMFNWKQVVIS